jgi:tetratricopeptide (TPR) repeat protein
MLYAYAKCKDAAATYLMGKLEKAEEDLLDGINRFKHTKDHFSSLGYHWLRHIYSIIGAPHLILEAAQQELNAAEATGDVEIIGYAHYGICHGMALKGEFETAMQAGDTSVRLLESNQSYFRAIGFMERGFAHLQMSNYRGAREDFKQGIQVLNSMVLHLEILTPLLPRMIEACIGPNWNDGPKAELIDLRTASRYALRARFFSNVFPNIRPHVLRVMGRYYFVKGKTNKARKYFEASIAAAEKLGARFEHARALDDSGRAFPELAERRIQAREILAELDAVMPVAECVDYHGPVLKTQTESEPTASLPMASPT